MKHLRTSAVGTLALGLLVAAVPVFAADFFNGFETDTTDWYDFGGTVTRVASGTDGIASSAGDYHAVIDGSAYTKWGGYENAFPANGYITEIDVYLDMAEADGSDKRFDFSSAINKPDGTHRRDFIFNVGTNAAVSGAWVASASNNAPGWPADPGRNPVDITETGWYTLKSTFTDNGSGILTVLMEILDADENVVGSWTLSDPTDQIGVTVGGNRYGWFTSQRFDFDSLAIDNSRKMDIVPFVRSAEITSPAPEGTTVSGVVAFAATLNDEDGDDTVKWAVREGTCAAGINTVFGNVDGFSDSYSWDGASFLATTDTSSWTPGSYCFVFNPSESAGDDPIRETREFVIEEPLVGPPTDKDECKNGGWMTFDNPSYKNQGQCIAAVVSNGKKHQ